MTGPYFVSLLNGDRLFTVASFVEEGEQTANEGPGKKSPRKDPKK